MRFFNRGPKVNCPRCGHLVPIRVIAEREARHRQFWTVAQRTTGEPIPPLSSVCDLEILTDDRAECGICNSKYYPESLFPPLLPDEEIVARIEAGTL